MLREINIRAIVWLHLCEVLRDISLGKLWGRWRDKLGICIYQYGVLVMNDSLVCR